MKSKSKELEYVRESYMMMKGLRFVVGFKTIWGHSVGPYDISFTSIWGHNFIMGSPRKIVIIIVNHHGINLIKILAIYPKTLL